MTGGLNLDMLTTISYVDAAVILIIIVFAFSNARKGLAGALIRFAPTLFGIILSWKMSDEGIKYARDTFVFRIIKDKIEGGLNLENILPDMTMNAQNEMIQNMNIPDFIKNALVTNNNEVVYELFDAQTLNEYVAGFIANILISIVVVVLIFLAGFIIGRIVLGILDFANDIPVLGFFSRLGGFFVGIIKGICIIWVIGIIITFVCCEPWAQDFMAVLETSAVAGWFYKNNILLFVVLQIIA